jgi:uncharacterized RDD family membrane protein YckC
MASPKKTLGATMFASFAILTIGYTDKLPSPRRYVAIGLLYFILGVVAEFGANAAKWAMRLGAIVLLSAIAGQAGVRLTAFLKRTAARVTATPTGGPPQSSSSQTAGLGKGVLS